MENEKDAKTGGFKAKTKSAYQVIATSEGKQRMITFIAYLLVVMVTVLSALWQVVFGIENFNFTRFFTNLCFNIAITIIIMILSMRDGELSNETSRKGEYFEVKSNFKLAIKKIISRDAFRQFCDVLFLKERTDYEMTELAKVCIYDEAYLKINNSDFESLKEEPKKCIIGKDKDGNQIYKPLDSLNEIQYDALEYYRSGEFEFPKLEYTYFTSQGYRNTYQAQARLTQHQRNTKVWSVIYRCILIIIIMTVLSFAVINPNKGENYVQQAIYDTITKLLNMITSMFFGYMIANDEAKQNAEALQFKMDIIDQYIDESKTGAFVPKDIDSVVLEKIKELEEQRIKDEEEKKRKEQEAIDSVITPEVVNDKNDIVEIEMTDEQYQSFKK